MKTNAGIPHPVTETSLHRQFQLMEAFWAMCSVVRP